MRAFSIIVAITCAVLASCATPYQRMNLINTGGYKDQSLGNDVYQVGFGANGYTTHETAQTLWLWRCSELTIEKGFDGFQILSDMRLSQTVPTLSEDGAEIVPAAYVVVPVPVDQGQFPYVAGDIRLLKGPVATSPPKVFDARTLKAALEPIVSPVIKNGGNVKPHVHEYLVPATGTSL
jgi:hypothetical protein